MHKVLMRPTEVEKTFREPKYFGPDVAALRRLQRLANGKALPGGWTMRVPDLLSVDAATSTIVMTRADAATLSEMLDRGEPIDWTAVGEALGALHVAMAADGGGIHGDATIENVLLNAKKREIWIIDPGEKLGVFDNPWIDLLLLLWPLFRFRTQRWTLPTAEALDVLRGWRRVTGRPVDSTLVEAGWERIVQRLSRAHAHKRRGTLHRNAAYFVYRRLWLPTVLRRA